MRKSYETENVCLTLARIEVDQLKRLGKLDARSIAIAQANFRARYSPTDAEKICNELDRLYREPSLFAVPISV